MDNLKGIKSIATILVYAAILAACSGGNKPMDFMSLSVNSAEYKNNITVDDAGVMYYKRKKFNGEINVYNEKKGGYLNHQSTYQSGLEHGTHYWFYPNGKPYTTTEYVEGKRHGQEKKYTEDGKLQFVVDYENDTVKENKYYNNDILLQREVILGAHDMLIEQFDSSGKLKTKGKVANRKKSFRLSFIDETRDGTWEFYEAGKLQLKKQYKNGKLIREMDAAILEMIENKASGTFKEYWGNTSSVKRIMNFKNGKPEGEWKYFSWGNLIQKETYEDGKEHGIWETYSSDGLLVKRIGFEHGTLSGTYEEYHYNGKPEILGSFKDGEEEGVWKEFAMDGKLLWKEEYKQGKMVGIWEKYHDNGNLYWKFELDNGVIKEDGINEMFEEDGSPM